MITTKRSELPQQRATSAAPARRLRAAGSNVLLQEAQEKVTALMAELYGKRRELWETQQALNQVGAESRPPVSIDARAACDTEMPSGADLSDDRRAAPGLWPGQGG